MGGRIQPVPCGESLYTDVMQHLLKAEGNITNILHGAPSTMPSPSSLPSSLGDMNTTLSPVVQQILKQGIDLDAFCARGKNFWGDRRFPFEFFECDTCKGGVDFKCDEKYRGRLCAKCADRYFNMGTIFHCPQCCSMKNSFLIDVIKKCHQSRILTCVLLCTQ